ncbi:MAG: hypothetical protein COW88_02305 [Candidatus Lloydbacteria bacterium CG22_combo_CG10-13_8_21_14_all_47_15]|uniref:Uncharacterized protein n=1 Tax=Candidatus Lloydbacteria bacterium CG22_combo_CG10-13_8_21_14_all_47_15 TaxID=1974635 RepID=A0A2H0CTY8_9BACT|nr:MAG: hypothetical protein COW88_02305 [Candidatus Lloydbacteria bacterium CG22_combo_CG10-13_8_21_14_all_47_15]
MRQEDKYRYDSRALILYVVVVVGLIATIFSWIFTVFAPRTLNAGHTCPLPPSLDSGVISSDSQEDEELLFVSCFGFLE